MAVSRSLELFLLFGSVGSVVGCPLNPRKVNYFKGIRTRTAHIYIYIYICFRTHDFAKPGLRAKSTTRVGPVPQSTRKMATSRGLTLYIDDASSVLIV